MRGATILNNFQKYLVWLALGIPAVFTFVRYLTDDISYGQVIHETGDWSIGLLMATLFITPLIRLWPSAQWIRWFMRQRRAMGVASFGYAAFHTLAYLDRKWGYGYILPEAKDPGLLTGWIALVIFILLALTSNNVSVRLMKQNWQRLHRLVYIATGLIFAHWILTAFETVTAYVCLGLVLLIELLRWYRPLYRRFSKN